MKNSLTKSQNGLTKEQQLRALREARFKKSDGGVEGHAGGVTSLIKTSPPCDGRSEYPHESQKGAGLPPAIEARSVGEASAGVEPGPSEPIRKRGRPPAGETRDKPWIAAGMSKATWYRRQKGK
jgi:hypothetical protein